MTVVEMQTLHPHRHGSFLPNKVQPSLLETQEARELLQRLEIHTDPAMPDRRKHIERTALVVLRARGHQITEKAFA